MRITWSEERERFEAESAFEERFVLKQARWRWDPTLKGWWTDKEECAAPIAQFADDGVRARLEKVALELDEARAASRATDAQVEIPAPEGLSYLPFQRAGIAFASARPSTLIADEMGLGKTIQALGVVNLDETVRRVLVVCPASLRLNWKREAEKWLVRPLTVGVASSKEWPDTQVVIVNYDILHKHEEIITATPWDVLVVDEAHYVKNPKARRSKQVYAIPARRRLFLTGTPIVNRPVELFPIINTLDPKTWNSFFSYAKRYCDAYHTGWGWDFTGASNLEELQDRLRTSVMVRRLKRDVLTELPPKVRQVIDIPQNGAAAAVKKERAAYEQYQDTLADLKAAVELAKASDDPNDYKDAVDRLREGVQAAFTEMSRARHEVALAKVPYVVEHLKNALEGGEKVIVFAHHHDVVDAIAQEFGEVAVTLTGRTRMEERQAAVDRFQNDPEVTLFIGSITAAGVGLTLTKSSHVVFAELDWVPGNVTQAEDRAHRIGQQNSVLVQHLVLDESLDATMARTLVRKQDVIDRALDKEGAKVPLLPELPNQGAATERTSREQLVKEAPEMEPERVEAIHQGLRMLAGVCDGAYSLDGAGFSKIDTRVGKSLAGSPGLSRKQAALGLRLVNKYRRQLPAELLAAAKGVGA